MGRGMHSMAGVLSGWTVRETVLDRPGGRQGEEGKW
jgi:hypothetical protein